MTSIKPLPEAARNSMRSGIVLSDLTRVVEELVFNSLDAGATKLSVLVGVGNCYVKVVDNGSGISRDGLAIVGERYATSKLWSLADTDATCGVFGFRGESLASISDISLLEIVTKASGKPNGYRKIMKGSKCLYLGIDDDRKDAGTTVVVRDLFYNQPVRRKYMQSSPKKVLHSVKKCVLRIALVHSKVSFNVVDIESDQELLSTNPSSSPLSLLMKGFGVEDLNSLVEVNASDGLLKLSGCISGPTNAFAAKVFQYVYINSRLVGKGPIHKLLNHLAASFECLSPWNGNDGSLKGKRSRPQAIPAYILNLICPQSLYDLSFEASKACAEFKDWKPVLSLIKKTIEHIWRENLAIGSFDRPGTIRKQAEMHEEDWRRSLESTRKKHKIENHQTSTPSLYSPLDELMKDDDHLFQREHERSSCWENCEDAMLFKGQLTKVGFLDQDYYSFQSWDSMTQKNENCLCMPDDNLSADSYFLKDNLAAAGKSNHQIKDNILRSHSTNESFQVEQSLENGSGGGLPFDFHEFDNGSEISEDIGKPSLRSCTLRGSLPLDGALFPSEEGSESSINLLTEKKSDCSDKKSNILGVDVKDRNFSCFSKTLLEDESSCAWQHSRLITEGDMAVDSNFISRASAKSFLSYNDHSSGEKFDSDAQVRKKPCPGLSGPECCSGKLDPLFQSEWWEAKHFTGNGALGGSPGWYDGTCLRNFVDSENDCRFYYDTMSKRTNQGKCTSSCMNVYFDLKDYSGSRKGFCEFLEEKTVPYKSSTRNPSMLADFTDWLHQSSSKNCRDIDKHKSQRDELRHRDCEQKPLLEKITRSHSAPPFFRQKRGFISLNHCSMIDVRKSDDHFFEDASTHVPDISRHLQQQCSGLRQLHLNQTLVEDVSCCARPHSKKLELTSEMRTIDGCGRSLYSPAHEAAPVEVEIQDSLNSRNKWRDNCPLTTNIDKSFNLHHQDKVLDISAGFLQHLAGDSLVPESIGRNCLEDAKVLQQLDKKFIPVVAGGTLAVIDQHAADERIRLEELRQKVLCGEEKKVAYLDAEQELILPEIGYQLLQNYYDHVEDWGWICNVHVRGLESFKKSLNVLHKQRNIVMLLAVPCILGVNLTDIDLLEFLQQLADTDGSSTIPPSVLRVLNSKACRGAIMFGDSLLPSECSLIIDELKRTSLCFQCAHGRPTTAPLVSMEALHMQIAKLGSSEAWHGLHRHEVSLDRAIMRLSAARGSC